MAEYYKKINWKDGADGGTPLSAENLNKMEEGISGAEMRTGPLEYNKENDSFSAGDKIQLDTNGNLKVSGTITDGNNNVLGTSISVDNEISDVSENPVQNKVIKSYIDDITGDINTALEEIIAIQEGLIGEPETITFNLNGTNYTCPKGMTWAALETYDDGAIWAAEELNIQGSVVYAGSAQLITWDMNIPTSLATYISDIISDVTENFNYSI